MANIEDSMELSDIRQRMSDLNQEAKSLVQKGRKRALGEILKFMGDFDITVQDIEQAANKPAQVLRNPTYGLAKYQDPDTGKTWTGRGKAPKWLLEKEAKGVSRETLRISDGSGSGE